jgi:hypothetical protein
VLLLVCPAKLSKHTHRESKSLDCQGSGELFAYTGKQSNATPTDEMATLEKQTSNALIEGEFSRTKIPTGLLFHFTFVDAL